jgi:hypothetical protein
MDVVKQGGTALDREIMQISDLPNPSASSEVG